jgi:DNA repair exonuclease SbcCD ATPase subunit
LESQRLAILQVLSRAAKGKKNSKVGRIAGMVRAGNPFTKVLEEIDKMKELIEEEAKLDAEQKAWCEKEREENDAMLEEKKTEIETLETEITDLDTTINDPATGLKFQIEEKETALIENSEAQAEETKIRREENAAYQEDIGNLVEATEVLKEAIAVLEEFYKAAKEGTSLAQKGKKDSPEPPKTWDEPIKPSDTGYEVIEMLTFVLTETQKEETAAHEAEEKAQGLYEDSMGELKQEESDLTDALAQLKEKLAEAEKALAQARADLEKTEKEKLAIERYLESIKPGCDFIIDNYDARETARSDETSALEKAVELLKASPGFATAETVDLHEEWGPCKETCIKDEAHVECKACLAKVTVPGYCAGHPDTAGC